jgi:hypothetical protein
MQPSSATNASSTTTSSTIGTATKKPDSSKPGTSTPRVTSPRQEANPHFDTPLRMHDFYKADPIFKQLGATLKQSGANADTRKLLAGFASTMESIRKTVLEAEKLFTPHSRKDCALRLEASKANQVRWLVEIDAVADTILPAKRRGEIHDACVELGRALSKMLVQAKALERAGFADQISPPQGQQKRAQSHPDSPVLTTASPKRRKVDTPHPTSPGAVSSPGYKPAPVIASTPSVDSDGSNAVASTASSTSAISTTSSVSSTSTTSTSSSAGDPVSQPPVTSPNSPVARKRHRLGAQPRPRPASQLFAAPPDFKAKAVAAPLQGVDTDGNRHVKQADHLVDATLPDAR